MTPTSQHRAIASAARFRPRKGALILAALCLTCSWTFAIVISEIMYNPEGGSEELEFIELYNELAEPFDLGGWRFTDGIRFVFPDGADHPSIIGGIGQNRYLVLAKDAAAFEARYGFAPFGQYEGNLDNAGERLILSNDAGTYDADGMALPNLEAPRIISLTYNDRGAWPAACDGTGHSLSLINPYRAMSDPSNWAPSPMLGGTPGAPNGFENEVASTTLIADGALWRYYKGTAAFPAGWTNTFFDHSAWSQGQSGFGYADSDDRTVLSDMRGGYMSIAIRHSFTLADPSAFDRLVLQVWYDDGFVAYLNGHEVARSANIAGTPPPHTATAQPDHEAVAFEDFDISAFRSSLRAGVNVLAIQGHNASLSSSDFSLRPVLVGQTTLGGAGAAGVVFNECFWLGPGAHFLELYNRGSVAADISGCFLSNDAQNLRPEGGALPPVSVLAPGAFLALREAKLPFTFGPAPGKNAFKLFLTAPDGSRVIAARAFEADVGWGDALGSWPDGAAATYAMPPTEGTANTAVVETDLVINEIMYHPFYEDDPYSTDDNGLWGDNLEYIELYNRGTRTLDLSGYRFTQGIQYTFPEGTLCAPLGYVVIAKNPARLAAVYGAAVASALGPYEGVLSNKGELIRLKDARGNTVNEVQYSDGGRWPRWADGGGSSLELIDPFQDNSFATAWAASDETAKAQWHHVSYQGPPAGSENELHLYLTSAGEVLLDDVRLRPAPTSTSNYVANGGFESGTAGWIIEGTHAASEAVSWDAHSGSRSLLIRAESRGDTRTNRIETQLNQPYPATCYIDYWAKWQRGTNRLLTRTHWHGAPFCAALPVPVATGTPGARNSVYQANQGPVIDSLDQDPKTPAGGQPVTVTCRAADADGVAGVTLYWRREEQSTWNAVPMADDGLSGDGRAGDGVWGGVIPAQADGSIVEFHVEALDSAANIGVFPPGSPAARATAMYRVGDASVNTKLLLYRANLRAADHAWLQARPRLSNELLPATFVFGNERVFYNVGLRYRGSPWIRPGTPGSGYRLKFNSEDRLFDREEEVNLDQNQQDSTKVKERTAFYLDRAMGAATAGVKIPFSEQHFVRFRYNGKDANNSIFLHVQKIDRDYLDFWWPGDDDGSLWKIDDYFEIYNDSSPNCRWRCNFVYRGADKESYRYIFNLRTRQKSDDWTQLIDFIDYLNNTDPAVIDATIDDVVDIREWSTIFAVRFFIGDWDTIGYLYGKNAFVYLPPRENRWKLIHWDSDLTFDTAQVGGPITPTDTFPVLRDLFARPPVRKLIMSDYAYLLAQPAKRSYIDPILDMWAATMAGEPGAGGVGPIKTFITSRTANIEGRLPAAVFAITTRGGADFATDEARVTLAGTAPVTADIFTVGGADLTWAVRWSAVTQWEIDLDLAPGANHLACAVYQRDGTLVGSDSITVTSNQVPPPYIDGIAPSQGPPAGGTEVAIVGGDFAPGAEVFFGRTQAPAVTFISSSELVATTPAGLGTVPVFVRNPNGAIGAFASFAYGETATQDVVVSSVNPAEGPASGGTTVVVRGSGFDAGARVFFGGRRAPSVTRVGDTELRAVAPPAWPLVATVGVMVRNSDGSEGYRPRAFTYIEDQSEPMIFGSITPASGSVRGGFQATIAGANLPPRPEDCAVLFGLIPAAVVSAGPQAVTVLVPEGRIGPVDVTVADSARGLRVTAPRAFEYLPSAGSFVRGDANGDGTLNIADVLHILDGLFGTGALDCLDAADVNDDGKLDVADPVYLLDFMFGRGPEPPAPFPDPG